MEVWLCADSRHAVGCCQTSPEYDGTWNESQGFFQCFPTRFLVFVTVFPSKWLHCDLSGKRKVVSNVTCCKSRTETYGYSLVLRTDFNVNMKMAARILHILVVVTAHEMWVGHNFTEVIFVDVTKLSSINTNVSYSHSKVIEVCGFDTIHWNKKCACSCSLLLYNSAKQIFSGYPKYRNFAAFVSLISKLLAFRMSGSKSPVTAFICLQFPLSYRIKYVN